VSRVPPAVAMFLLTTLTAARAESVWDKAERDIRRVAPAVVPGLPKAVARELEKRECRIPQTYLTTKIHNAIPGSFRAKGSKDWAVLCSKGGVSSLLIFWGGSIRGIGEYFPSPDKNWLQGIGETRAGFSRHIGRIEPGRIAEYQARDAGAAARPFDHDGIEEAFLEKASTVRYFDGGGWVEVPGAD
jgi:hypothetical protein